MALNPALLLRRAVPRPRPFSGGPRPVDERLRRLHQGHCVAAEHSTLRRAAAILRKRTDAVAAGLTTRPSRASIAYQRIRERRGAPPTGAAAQQPPPLTVRADGLSPESHSLLTSLALLRTAKGLHAEKVYILESLRARIVALEAHVVERSTRHAKDAG